MAPLAISTILHRRSITGLALPWNPPLIPAGPFSRTAAWLKGQAFTDHATFWWANGWGRILSYHRAGGPKLPIRDVFGISRTAIRSVRNEGVHWWRGAKQTVPLAWQRKTEHIKMGNDTYTYGGSSLAELRKAIQEGRFTGWNK